MVAIENLDLSVLVRIQVSQLIKNIIVCLNYILIECSNIPVSSWVYFLFDGVSSVGKIDGDKKYGYSLRCIKDF